MFMLWLVEPESPAKEVLEFLTRMAADADDGQKLRSEYEKDPEAAMESADLSPGARELLRQNDKADLIVELSEHGLRRHR